MLAVRLLIIDADENDDCHDDADADGVLFVAVKTKFAYAYTTEFPYRMTHVLECEFFLLEAMVSATAAAVD